MRKAKKSGASSSTKKRMAFIEEKVKEQQPLIEQNIALKIISQQIAKADQDVNFFEVLSIGTTKLRISIRSNSYQFQSHARIEIWTGSAWKEVHHILPCAMATKEGLCYERLPVTAPAFAKDRAALLTVARQILDLGGAFA